MHRTVAGACMHNPLHTGRLFVDTAVAAGVRMRIHNLNLRQFREL